MNNIVIFESGERSVEVRLEGETVWLSLQQLAELFDRDKSAHSTRFGHLFQRHPAGDSSVIRPPVAR